MVVLVVMLEMRGSTHLLEEVLAVLLGKEILEQVLLVLRIPVEPGEKEEIHMVTELLEALMAVPYRDWSKRCWGRCR